MKRFWVGGWKVPLRWVQLAMVAGLLAACATPRPQHAEVRANSAVVAQEVLSQPLDVGDLIRIDLAGQQPLVLQTRLDEGGAVKLPVAGQVRALGLTPRQFETALAEALRRNGSALVPQVQVLSRSSLRGTSRPAPAAAPLSSAAAAPRPAAPASSATPAAPAAAPPGRLEYRLGVGDQIRIQVHGEDDLALQTRLDEKGTVTFAFLGEVRAVGQSVLQLEGDITRGLREGGYLKSPEVQVLVLEYRPFYVNGEVKRPGGYPYVPGLTAQKAVTLAGGFTPLASRNKLFVVRETSGDGAREKISLDSVVLPGDTVIVEEGLF